MPGFAKSPPWLVERFDAIAAIAAARPEVERRLTFGYPCLYVGGNMVSGLHESAWFVRLADADRAKLLDLDGSGPFEVMPGRPMKGYALLPATVIADDAAVNGWLERAIAFGRTLPPKPAKAKAASRTG